MSFTLRDASPEDAAGVMAVFNHFVENSTAAYPDKKLDDRFFTVFTRMAGGYPFFVAENDAGKVIGFGLLHRYHQAHTFDRTAEVTYFIDPAWTRQGLGSLMLAELTDRARHMGVDSLLASVSSLNEASFGFHKASGFAECGRFIKVGRKFGQDFDLIWMQKRLAA